MKIIAGVMVGGGLVLGSWAASRLSSDAVAMTIGMALGMLAIVPAVVLVVAARGGQATYYGLDDGHVNLRGDDLDGTWRRDPAPAPQPVVVVVQEPATANTGRFRVAWQSDNAAMIPVNGTTRWAQPVDGVVLAAGVERDRRMVWATEPVAAAIASGGLCLVRADEWDAWLRWQREVQS